MTVKLLDAVLFGALLSSSVLLLLRRSVHRRAAWIVLTAAIVLLLLLIERKMEAVRQRKEREQIAQTIRTEKLLLMRDTDIERAIGERSFIWIRSQKPEPHEILQAIAKHPKALICMGNCKTAKTLLAAYAPQTRLIGEEELVRLIRPDVTEKEIVMRQKKPRDRRFSKDRLRRLQHVPFNRYLLLGTLLLVLSFLSKHKIYYRTISSICLFFALCKGLFEREKVAKKFRFFLDNMDR